jgi:hypothetical protein
VAHDVAQCLPVAPRAGRVDRLAPRLDVRGPGVTEVQRRLEREEVGQEVARPPARRWLEPDERHPLVGRRRGQPVGPDVPVVGLVVHRGAEPGVLVRGVRGHEVQQHPDAPAAGGFDQRREVVHGAVARIDGVIVAHVVPGVTHRRGEARGEPDGVRAQPRQVLQPGLDAAEIADAVAIAVGEALRIDLVEHGVGQPGRKPIFCHAVTLRGRGIAGPMGTPGAAGLCSTGIRRLDA